MEEGMDKANGITVPEDDSTDAAGASIDDLEGLINAHRLALFGKECIAPIVRTLASLADSSKELAEKIEELEKGDGGSSVFRVPAVAIGSYTYNGKEQGPVIAGVENINVTGATGVDAGDYVLTLSLKNKEAQIWDDLTTEDKTYPWSIAKKTVGVPSLADTDRTYSGSAQSPTMPAVNADEVSIGGTTGAADAGTYTVTFTLSDTGNYIWADGTDAPKSGTWSIKKATLTVPSQRGSLTYTGGSQSPAWDNYDSGKMAIGGTTNGVNAGTYTATFTPGSNYQWNDGTTAAKSVTWTVKKASLAVPSQNGSLTYTGGWQAPAWNNYDSGKMAIGGTANGINAGTYTATFTPGSNYQWGDGTTAAKSVSWGIGKAAGSLALNRASMDLNISALTGTIAVTRSGDGAITASSSNTGVASVSVSGTTITVTGKASGSATITVNVGAGTNHTAPAAKTCAVTATVPVASFASNTPATIQAAARAGVAPNYWSVGDRIGIAVNGTFGGLTYNGTVYAFIIGFNHNPGVEGSNSIHFQFGKTDNGTDIAFSKDCDSANKGFYMNVSDTNNGGWASSYMRGTTCQAFLSALPIVWQNVIANCTKYSNNTGGEGDTASKVTSTSDRIWLLSEFEVFGVRSWANSAERNYQKQYDYYKNGNSKIKYKHSKTTEASKWWLRSTIYNSGNRFSAVSENGTNYFQQAIFSQDFAPGFMVA